MLEVKHNDVFCSLFIAKATCNSHATHIKGKIFVYCRIKPHGPLLKLRPAKSIPFPSCHGTMEATLVV